MSISNDAHGAPLSAATGEAATSPPSQGFIPDSKLADTAFSKAALRLMPLLVLCYLSAFLDRVNVGFAALTVFDIIFCTHRAEDVIDEPTVCPSVMLHELDAVIGKHRVDFVGYRFDQSFKEAGCHKLCRLAIDSGDDDL